MDQSNIDGPVGLKMASDVDKLGSEQVRSILCSREVVNRRTIWDDGEHVKSPEQGINELQFDELWEQLEHVNVSAYWTKHMRGCGP